MYAREKKNTWSRGREKGKKSRGGNSFPLQHKGKKKKKGNHPKKTTEPLRATVFQRPATEPQTERGVLDNWPEWRRERKGNDAITKCTKKKQESGKEKGRKN